jgi:hypothetical protein
MKMQKSDRVGFICEHDLAGLRTKPGMRVCGGGGHDSTEPVLLQTCFAGRSWLDLLLLGEHCAPVRLLLVPSYTLEIRHALANSFLRTFVAPLTCR